MTSLRILLLFLLAGGFALFAAVPGDANGDGILNAADHAFIQAILSRRLEPTEAADVDGDGTVTAIDAAAVADMILGQTPFLAVGSGELPTMGGTVVVEDLDVSATAGALPTAAGIVVSAAQQEAPYEGDDDSPLYRIEGIPTRHGEGITLSLPAASAGRGPSREGEILVEVGELVSLPSTAEPHIGSLLVVPRVEDGRLVVDLPVLDLPPARRDEDIPATRTVLIRRVTGIAAADDTLPEDETRAGAGVAVRIYRPSKMTAEQYQPVLDALGSAIKKLKGLGFSPSDRTTPVYVYLKKLGSGTCGSYVPSAASLDWSFLEINLTYVTDATLRAELERTVFHEYFHMVQSRYDPRFSFTKAKYNAPQLWFDEACSVWFEKYTPNGGGRTSSYMDNNAVALLEGHHMDCSGLAFLNETQKVKVQDHGYGLSAMLEFLFSHPDAPSGTLGKPNPALVNVYNGLIGGTDIKDAFLANVPAVTTWWDDMLLAFANNSIGEPGISFVSRSSTRMTSFKVDEASKSPAAKTINVAALDDCESWVIGANWQKLGAKDGRSLVAEVASPDNALRSVCLNSARNQTCPVAAEGTSFGKYGTSYVSWLATPMESTNNGLDIRPIHYLLMRHFGKPVAGAPGPVVRLWYVDEEMPVNTTAMKETWDAVAPKLIDYSLVGTAICKDSIQTHETKLYDSAALTNMVARGGASYLFPSDGAFQMQFSVQLTADIAEESVYRIKQYRVRTYYHDKAGEVSEAYVATYATPGQTTNIDLVVTLGANDEHVFVDVAADEDFKPGATLDSGVPYSLRSWFCIGTLARYEVVLESRYGAKAGSRTGAATPTCIRQDIIRKAGVTTTVSTVSQPVLALPAATAGEEP